MKADAFRWIEWNREHATRHGCTIAEIESVVRREVRRNRFRPSGDDKFMVTGRGQGDRHVEVAFLVDDDGSLFVIHAMPLTGRRRRG